MYDKAANTCLSALKFISYCFFMNKILGILNDVFNDDTDLDYVNSDVVTCFSEDMVINTINLNNINSDDDSFDDNNL